MLDRFKTIFYWLKSKRIRVIDTVFVVCLLSSYLLFKATDINLNLDFNYTVALESGYAACMGKHGNSYIIDNGKNRLLRIKDKKVIWSIGEEDDKKFDQIENVAVDQDSENIYLHGLRWNDSGYLVSKETIAQYDSNGKYLKTLYTADYEDSEERKSKIFGLRFVDQDLEFIRADEQGFEHVKLVDKDSAEEDEEEEDEDEEEKEKNSDSDDKKAVVKSKYKFEDAIDLIRDYTIYQDGEAIYLTDKRGKIFVAKNREIQPYIEFDPTVEASGVSVGSDESLYFTDLRTSSINRISKDKKIEKIIDKEDVFSNANLPPNKGLVFLVKVDNVTFQDGQSDDVISAIYDGNVFYARTTGGKVLYNDSKFSQGEKYFVLETIADVSLIICILSGLYVFTRVAFILIFNKFKFGALFKIEIIVILTTILISACILPLTLPTIYSVYEKYILDKLSTVSQIASNNLDADKIRKINCATDFMSEDYRDLVAQIRIMTQGNEYIDSRMGASLESFVDETAIIMAYQDLSTGSYHPMDYGASQELKWVYENKKPKTIYVTNSEGHFIVARSPIFDSDGEVVAAISITKDASIIQNQLSETIIQVVIHVISLVIFITFVVNEAIAYLDQRAKYKRRLASGRKLRGAAALPIHSLRLSNVVFSTSINLSSIFLPIYTLTFYSKELGIPKMLAGSIPLSINTMFITIVPVFAWRIFSKLGFRKVMIISGLCLIGSNILLALTSSYYLMTLALLINGFSYSLLIESKASYAKSSDEETAESIDFMCGSGENSGQFLGTIIGAFLYSFLEYREVFLSSAAIGVISLIFCIYFCVTYVKPKIEASKNKKKSTNKLTTLKFIMSKRIFLYIISVIIGWGIISKFADYYIPIYGDRMNLYEEQTSILMAITSFGSVFLGAYITKISIRKFKSNAITVAMFLSFISMVLLSQFNNLNIFTISLFILGIAYSFGTNAAKTAFIEMGSAQEFDEDKTEGIFNLFLAFGTTASSTLFGMMIDESHNLDVWMFIGISITLILIFKLLCRKKEKNKHNSNYNFKADLN